MGEATATMAAEITIAMTGVRDAVASTPIMASNVGIHHADDRVFASATPSGTIIANSTPSAMGWSADPTARISPYRLDVSDPSNRRKGKTTRTWSKTLNPVLCSMIEKNATAPTPDTMTFVTLTTAAVVVTTLEMR